MNDKHVEATAFDIADGLTKIGGMLTNFVAYFTDLNLAPQVNLPGSVTSQSMVQIQNTLPDALNNFLNKFNNSMRSFKLLTDIGQGFQQELNWTLGGKQSLAGQGVMLGYSGGYVQGGQYTEVHTSSGLFGHGHNDTAELVSKARLAGAV